MTGRPTSDSVVDGVQYDHVFPIEVDGANGGVVSLQMGYNTGENPFVAAQRFVDAHNLPQYHLAQIADYVQQRMGQQPATLGTAAPAASVPVTAYEYLPSRTYKSFELAEKTAATTLDKMKNKICELHHPDDTNLQHITSLMATLAAGNRYHSSKVSEAELRTVSTLLSQSSVNQAFPILDLARLAALHPDAASKPTVWGTIVQRTLALAGTTTEDLSGPSAVAIPMLSLRLFANAFKGGSMAKQAVTTYLDVALDCAARSVASTNKNIRLSVATFLYNTCFFLKSSTNDDAAATKIVALVETIIDCNSYENEALFRVLVAVGTLVLAYPALKTTAAPLISKVEMAASPHSPQTKAVAKEVYAVLQP